MIGRFGRLTPAPPAAGDWLLTVIGATDQAGLKLLERRREGIADAKREWRDKGRVPTARRQAAEIARLKADGIRPSEIAVRLGIGRASVYRVLAEQNAGAAA
jgi:DNA invertase Pin-like site-specific DNA recombinase